jgi:hypothetical protein
MQPISITRSKEDLLYQYDCLVQLENYANRRDYGGVYKAVFAITGFTVLLYLFTPSESLMVLKAISLPFTALAWVFLLVVTLWLLGKRLKTRKNIQRWVEMELNNGKQYYMYFDEKGLTYGSENFKTEVCWSHYFCYLETPTVVLLFTKGAKYDFASFSAFEIGEVNLAQLKAIVREELPLLSEKIHLNDRVLLKVQKTTPPNQ